MALVVADIKTVTTWMLIMPTITEMKRYRNEVLEFAFLATGAVAGASCGTVL